MKPPYTIETLEERNKLAARLRKRNYYPENSIRTYRVWHGRPEDFHKRGMRQLELVEAYSGKEARQIVRDMFPGHSVGNPVLWKK